MLKHLENSLQDFVHLIYLGGPKILFQSLLVGSILGWLTIFLVTYYYTRNYRSVILSWISPIIRIFYFFLAANACHVGWVLFLATTTTDYPITFSRISFEFLRMVAVFSLATVMQTYYRRLPSYMVRIANHKRNSDRFQAITDAIHDAIIEIDEDSSIGYANPAAARIFGYQDEIDLILAKKITFLMPVRYRTSHLQGISHYLKTGESHLLHRRRPITLVGLHKDGSEFPIEITISSYTLGDKHRFVAIIRDLSPKFDD